MKLEKSSLLQIPLISLSTMHKVVGEAILPNIFFQNSSASSRKSLIKLFFKKNSFTSEVEACQTNRYSISWAPMFASCVLCDRWWLRCLFREQVLKDSPWSCPWQHHLFVFLSGLEFVCYLHYGPTAEIVMHDRASFSYCCLQMLKIKLTFL